MRRADTQPGCHRSTATSFGAARMAAVHTARSREAFAAAGVFVSDGYDDDIGAWLM